MYYFQNVWFPYCIALKITCDLRVYNRHIYVHDQK